MKLFSTPQMIYYSAWGPIEAKLTHPGSISQTREKSCPAVQRLVHMIVYSWFKKVIVLKPVKLSFIEFRLHRLSLSFQFGKGLGNQVWCLLVCMGGVCVFFPSHFPCTTQGEGAFFYLMSR